MLKKDARGQCANCSKICARSAQKTIDETHRRPSGAALAAPFPPFPDMTSSDLPGPADPALGVSDSHIHPYMHG